MPKENRAGVHILAERAGMTYAETKEALIRILWNIKGANQDATRIADGIADLSAVTAIVEAAPPQAPYTHEKGSDETPGPAG